MRLVYGGSLYFDGGGDRLYFHVVRLQESVVERTGKVSILGQVIFDPTEKHDLVRGSKRNVALVGEGHVAGIVCWLSWRQIDDTHMRQSVVLPRGPREEELAVEGATDDRWGLFPL